MAGLISAPLFSPLPVGGEVVSLSSLALGRGLTSSIALKHLDSGLVCAAHERRRKKGKLVFFSTELEHGGGQRKGEGKKEGASS